MVLPTFLIVGAGKSGTTSLRRYLESHPQVFIPNFKECSYFSNMPEFRGPKDAGYNRRRLRTIEEYESVFSSVRDEVAIGENSPDYLYYHEESVRNIVRVLGDDTRIIAILRNPVDRAYSNYWYFRALGRERESFERALELEARRQQENWQWMYLYRAAGLYADQLRSFLDTFKSVKIYLFDDLVAAPEELIPDMYRFLGVDSGWRAPPVRHKATLAPRSLLLHRVCNRIDRLTPASAPATVRRWLEIVRRENQRRPAMQSETRASLAAFYRDDVDRLASLTGLDLSRWTA
jgi:hypothetical protein